MTALYSAGDQRDRTQEFVYSRQVLSHLSYTTLLRVSVVDGSVIHKFFP